MAFAETLTDFINADTPGYVLATIGGVAVAAIFEAAYASALDFSAGGQPVLHCAASAVPSVATGTAVVVNAVNYTVAEVQPDGTGLVVLVLEKV